MPELIQSWDLHVLLWLRSYHSQLAVWAAWVFATLAWKGVAFWLAVAAMWWRGYRMIACQLALALLIGSLDVALLKGWVLRPRPDLYAAQQLNIPMPELLSTSHSFPSGHTLVAAAAAVIFAATLRDWRAIVFFLFVIFVGVSRIYQGFHWPTDIIGSIVLGVVAGLLALWVCNQAPVKRLLSTDVGILEPEQVRQKTE